MQTRQTLKLVELDGPTFGRDLTRLKSRQAHIADMLGDWETKLPAHEPTETDIARNCADITSVLTESFDEFASLLLDAMAVQVSVAGTTINGSGAWWSVVRP